MTSFFNTLGHAFTKFFSIMPVIGGAMNLFIIASLTIGTFYWIYYMMKDPGKEENYLSKK